ncbi:MAG: class I SAM-dependent methyltransferase [Bacillota bacterium]
MQLDKIQIDGADEHFCRAILAFAEEKYAVAIQEALLASAMAPDDLLFSEAANYLQRVAAAGKSQVYATPEGFTEFIRSGGNVKLYERTSQLLSDCYSGYDQLRLLDIGVGDGRALLPALTKNIEQLDLLEPSATMLDCCKRALVGKKVSFNATCGTLQDYVAANEHGLWDIVQATFSLQSIQPDERQRLLGWISARCDRLLIAEFDVPEFATLYEPKRLQHIVSRYRNGLQEYAGDGGVVAQSFLLPVFFGYFDRSAARTNYEQKIDNWCEQLQNAGFASVTKRLIYPYWWADAYLIEASHC